MQKIPASTLSLVSFKHQTWCVMLPGDFDYKSCLDRDAWAHVAARLRPGDVVEVRNVRHSFYARLYVRAVDRLWAIVKEIEFVNLAPDETAAEEEDRSIDGMTVKWSNHKTRWAVVRDADKARIKDGFETRELATEWLDQFIKEAA